MRHVPLIDETFCPLPQEPNAPDPGLSSPRLPAGPISFCCDPAPLILCALFRDHHLPEEEATPPGKGVNLHALSARQRYGKRGYQSLSRAPSPAKVFLPKAARVTEMSISKPLILTHTQYRPELSCDQRPEDSATCIQQEPRSCQ